MFWTNSKERYGAAARVLHWAIAVLVIAALVLIETRGYWPRGSTLRRAFRDWHQQAALIAFLLLWLRFAVRLANRPPGIDPPPPIWQERMSHVLHAAFYVLLAALPILGVVMVQTDNRTVALLGFELPRWFAPDKPLTHQLEELHEFLGNIMIGAIALHAGAALWHHVVVRDNTLRRML